MEFTNRGEALNTPFTRLLLDSNFVSITDMTDGEGGIAKQMKGDGKVS